MIKNIIFDAYGTLISTGDGSIRATREIWQRHNTTADAADIYREWKRYHREHIDTLSEFITEREIFIRDLQRLYAAHGITGDAVSDVTPMLDSQYNRAPFSESREAIDALRTQYRVVIGSTTDTEPLLRNLEQAGLAVDRVFTSEELRVYKPKKEFYEAILGAMGWSAEQTLFVGDSLTDDIAGPKCVGMRAVLIDRTGRYVGSNLSVQPDTIIQSLCQLIEIIPSLK